VHWVEARAGRCCAERTRSVEARGRPAAGCTTLPFPGDQRVPDDRLGGGTRWRRLAERLAAGQRHRRQQPAVDLGHDKPAGRTRRLGAQLQVRDRSVVAGPGESKNHRLAGRATLGLHELADEVWINTTERDLCHQLILGACREAGFEPKVAFEVDEIATSQALVANGAGVTLLPSLALGSLHRDVAVASLGDATPIRRVSAARLATRYQTPASEAMLTVLREVAQGDPSGAAAGRA
jgi:DNA-binding transcriptional LysR family regulator